MILGFGLAISIFVMGVVLDKTFLVNPVEKDRNGNEIMMYRGLGSFAFRSFGAVSFEPPPVCFTGYIAQEFSDLPFG